MADIRRILIASDKFKGSLSAVEVAHHLRAGLRRAAPDVEVECLPVADGGEGTVEAAVAAGFHRRLRTVTGPAGDPVDAAFAMRDDTAVVELAQASGLPRLPVGVFAPMTASTYGTGELIRAALDEGARHIVLGVGGSAGVDGGAGMLTALGARFTDGRGEPLPLGGAALHDLAHADLSGLDPRLAGPAGGRCTVVLAGDVDNPLTGPKGAAAGYGPQKGASPEQVALLDAALVRYAEVLGAALGSSALAAAESAGAGAAGGAGYGALVGFGAVRRPGIELMLEVVGFHDALDRAQLVVTGEGALDQQTLHGKAPVGVAQAARRRGLEVVAVCGRLALGAGELGAAGIRRAFALTELEPDPERCIAMAGPLLERTGEAIARAFVLGV